MEEGARVSASTSWERGAIFATCEVVGTGSRCVAGAGRSVASPSGRSSTTMLKGWRAAAAWSNRSPQEASRPGGKSESLAPPAPHGGSAACEAPTVGICAPVLAHERAASSARSWVAAP